MVVYKLLDGLNYEGQLSLRRKTNDWFEYLAAGSQAKMKYRYGYYEVERTCIIDNVLVIYVK